jgi:hypothetical protein
MVGPPKNITHEGGRINATAKQPSSPTQSVAAKQSNFDFQIHFTGYDGTPLSGSFNLTLTKDYKTINTPDFMVVAGFYNESFTLDRNANWGTIQITGTPTVDVPLSMPILRGIGKFKLPTEPGDNTVLFSVKEETTIMRQTATTKEEAFQKFQASVGADVGIGALLLRIIKLGDFKLAGSVGGETSGTTTTETTHEWQVLVPTGALTISQTS